MANSPGNDTLVCQHGSARWPEWQVCRMPAGVAMLAPCECGDHYLQPDPAAPGSYLIGFEPFEWRSAVLACAARAAWRTRQVP
jgi:hypothetical protein